VIANTVCPFCLPLQFISIDAVDRARVVTQFLSFPSGNVSNLFGLLVCTVRPIIAIWCERSPRR